jgi:hypothetical protein
MQIMAEAGNRRWDSSVLAAELHKACGVSSPALASAEQLAGFLADLTGGAR